MDWFGILVFVMYAAGLIATKKMCDYFLRESHNILEAYQDIHGQLTTINCRAYHLSKSSVANDDSDLTQVGVTVWRNKEGKCWALFPRDMTIQELNELLIDAAVALNHQSDIEPPSE